MLLDTIQKVHNEAEEEWIILHEEIEATKFSTKDGAPWFLKFFICNNTKKSDTVHVEKTLENG